MSAPWTTFLFVAFKRDRARVAKTVSAVTVALLAFSAALYLFIPLAGIFAILYSPLVAGGIATLVVMRSMTRPVVVVRPDEGRVCLDEQSWWREDELQIPDAAKTDYKGKRTAFLSHVYEVVDADEKNPEPTVKYVGMRPFDPWREPLEFSASDADAGHVGNIKAKIKAATKLSMHEEGDRREVIRYGILAFVIGIGILAAYLALGYVVDSQ